MIVPVNRGEEKPAAPRGTAPRPRAFLVENDDVWGSILSRYLEARGLEVTWKRDTTDAIRFIEETDPDLIVADLQLPDHGGPQLLESIDALGERFVAKTALVTGFPTIAKAWANRIRVFDKGSLTGLGEWITQVLARSDRGPG